MRHSIVDEASAEDIARAAHKLAREALEHALEARRRLDELEHAQARTVESMKSIFADAVREHSHESAEALTKLSKDSEAQSASISKLVTQLSKQEEARTKELKTNRALFVVLACVLTVFVEYCRRT